MAVDNGVVSVRSIIEECLNEGKNYKQTAADVYVRAGKTLSRNYFNQIRRKIQAGDSSNRINNSATVDSASSADNEGNQGLSVTPAVQKEASLISGSDFVVEGGAAPIAPEAEMMADSYRSDGAADSNVRTDPVAGEIQMQQQQQQTVDLSQFAALPGVFESVLFEIPQIKKATGGYVVEEKDLETINKYAEILFKKHSGRTVTEHAEELNFIGAFSTPFVKGFGRRIGDLFSHLGKKKEEQERLRREREQREQQKREESKVSKPVVVPSEQVQADMQAEYQKRIAAINKVVTESESPS